MRWAAATTSGVMLCRVTAESRYLGNATLSAASTLPARSRIGAPTDSTPRMFSSATVAKPCLRTLASPAITEAGSVTVCGVIAASLP